MPKLEPGERLQVCDVAVDSRAGGGSKLWTYAVGKLDLARGDAVFVPLGPRPILGFVIRIYSAATDSLGFPVSHLRRVLNRIEGISLPEQVLSLVEYAAAEYLCPVSVAIGAAAPPGIRERVTSAWRRTGLDSTPHELTPLQLETLKVVEEVVVLRDRKGKRLKPVTTKALRLLAGKGLVTQTLALDAFDGEREGMDLLRLTTDAAKLERFLAKESKRKPAQALVVGELMASETAAITAAEVRALTGVTQTTVRALLQAGLLEVIEEGTETIEVPPEPNEEQAVAIAEICESLKGARDDAFLLYGVTGSGKTEVYLRAAAEALRQGKQVLYLVPEIALAAQAVSRLRARFGRRVTVLHSELSPLERLQNWARVREGSAPVVLGARSALFAPLGNLGLIIVDEEHETSYKQESAPRYHAKKLTLHLARQHSAPLVLGSATPSIESFFDATKGDLRMLRLRKRAASALLPTVSIENLTAGYRAGSPVILTENLRDNLEETLSKRQQAIMFLNRRAYAPFLLCRECGTTFMCPRCAVSLSYSRRDGQLRCHHCGRRERPPNACPSCSGTRLQPVGIGTEKVEEAIRELFPKAVIGRLDRDVAQRKGALEDTLARFRSGDIDVLVGTQMVAKGLDFPNVTLVGVILADTSLNMPDFRASERTFQLLSQVAGRAGRGKSPGRVFIQTFNPEHIAVTAARDHDYERIYEALIEERRAAHYPPFTRLVNVLVTGRKKQEVAEEAALAAERLHAVQSIEVLGPVDCAIERLQEHWRRHLLVKLPLEEPVKVVGDALSDLPHPEMVTIDVDAYSLV